jgi:hypothetical protein
VQPHCGEGAPSPASSARHCCSPTLWIRRRARQKGALSPTSPTRGPAHCLGLNHGCECATAYPYAREEEWRGSKKLGFERDDEVLIYLCFRSKGSSRVHPRDQIHQAVQCRPKNRAMPYRSHGPSTELYPCWCWHYKLRAIPCPGRAFSGRENSPPAKRKEMRRNVPLPPAASASPAATQRPATTIGHGRMGTSSFLHEHSYAGPCMKIEK